MNINSISCCYYPTKVILVDDNQKFLQQFQLALKLRGVKCESFLKPNLLLQYMENYSIPKLDGNCINLLNDGDIDRHTIDIDLFGIHKKIYDANRFDEISIIIADYAMPEQNGIAMMQELDDKKPIKRILLTGEADEKIAVDAFNRCLIHAYIRKDTPNFIDEVFDKILSLQEQHFCELYNDTIIGPIVKTTNSVLECFSDQVYLNFLNDIFASENAVEHYLLDSSGSFLMLDNNGNLNWLIVRDENDMQYYHQVAHDYYEAEERVPKEIIDSLANRKSVLFLYEAEQQLPPTMWQEHLYPASIINGKKKYYFSLIKYFHPQTMLRQNIATAKYTNRL